MKVIIVFDDDWEVVYSNDIWLRYLEQYEGDEDFVWGESWVVNKYWNQKQFVETKNNRFKEKEFDILYSCLMP